MEYIDWPHKLAISKYSGPMYYADHDLPHPAALLNNNWGKLKNYVQNFFDAYYAYESESKKIIGHQLRYAPKTPSDPSAEKVLAAYENVIYLVTEIIEDWTDNLKKCILPTDRYSEWKPKTHKKWRNHSALACNKLKHNHNFIVSVDAIYQYGFVGGYAVCAYKNDGVEPNVQVHPDKKPFSFGHDLRRIFVHLFLISHAIASEIERVLEKNIRDEQPQQADPKDIEFYQKLASFMPLTFHHYKKQTEIPLLAIKDGKLYIATGGGSIIPTGTGQIRTTFSGDGHTKTFNFF